MICALLLARNDFSKLLRMMSKRAQQISDSMSPLVLELRALAADCEKVELRAARLRQRGQADAVEQSIKVVEQRLQEAREAALLGSAKVRVMRSNMLRSPAGGQASKQAEGV